MSVRSTTGPRPRALSRVRRLRKLLPTGIVVFLWLLVLVSGVGQWVLLAARWQPSSTSPGSPFDFVTALMAIALASIGSLVVLRGDSWGYGWLMLWTGVVIGVIGFSELYSLYTLEGGASANPVAIWVQDLWMVPQMLGFLLLPALFPDGATASPRWRLPVRLATVAWIALITLFVLSDRPATNVFPGIEDPPANPTGFLAIPIGAFNVTWAVLLLTSIVIGIGSLVTRWRRADLELRQRLMWMIYAFGLLLALVGLTLVNGVLEAEGVDLGLSTPMEFLGSAAFLGLAVALGFAVLRFRLYNVDLVINRTMVYGTLTAAVVLTYIAVVVGAGALLPVQQSFLALVATGVVAVAFTPLKTRVQGWVNRLMFGQRDDPYAVLSEMGRLMTATGAPEETMQTLTETVATSLKLPGAAIELEQDGNWTTRASFGTLADGETDGVVIPLRHQGELVGRLVVMPRSSREPLTARDLALLEDIAHPAGAIARSVRLNMALQSSRERLVMAQEEERRRIRRDLHDGLGPSLASQTFQLDEVLERLYDDPVGAADLVKALKEQNQHLVADIRRLVYELRPPALDELGVAGALAAHVAQFERTDLTIEVRTTPDPLPALPAAVEVAAYRIAREAITNTIRHAGATRCTATLKATADKLIISVRDDGTGGIGQEVQTGVGLISMRERSEELGGTFEAVSPDVGGTEIVATLPLMNGSQEVGITSAIGTTPAGVRRG